MMTADEYILEASALEKEQKTDAALQKVRSALLDYPDNYELAFMAANEHRMLGNREEAYLYYLLSISLCKNAPEDLAVITKTAANAGLDNLEAARTKDFLRTLIKERLKIGAYTGTYQFVTLLVFSDDPFLFHEVNDSWLRYYHMLLEITDCEKNRGLQHFTADHMQDEERFHQAVTDLKFAARRIWFGIGEPNALTEVCDRWKLSPEAVVVTVKCSVTEPYWAAVLDRAAVLFDRAGKKKDGEVIRRYAEWIRQKGNAKELPEREKQKDTHEQSFFTVELDASEQNLSGMPALIEPEKTVAWIFCATKQNYVEEMLLYLKDQILPLGYSGIACVLWNSKSMTSGYNFAMEHIYAKYKIYIHQDTFLFGPFCTKRFVEALQRSEYSLLGVAGGSRMPETGRWWDVEQEAIHMCLLQDMVMYVLDSVTEKGIEQIFPLETLDGVLLATKVDVPFRSDLFTDYHFYDVSACMEYRKRGLLTGLLQSGRAGVLHEVSVTRGSRAEIRYEEERQKFVREYMGKFIDNR